MVNKQKNWMDNKMPGKFLVGVSIILHNNGSVLIGKRAVNQYAGGVWEFPSGRLEQGEDPFEGVIREGMEELRLNLYPIQIIDSYTFKRKNEDVILLNILCDYQGELTKSQEHDELKWVPLNKLDEYFIFEAQLNTVISLKQYLEILK